MDVQKLLKENHVKYGLIMTAVTAAWILIMHFAGVYTQPDKDSAIDLIFIILSPIVVWYLGIVAKRTEQKGKLEYVEGLKEGIKIGVVYGIVSPFAFMLYYLLINPEIIPYVKDSYRMAQASTSVIIIIDYLAQFVAAVIGGAIYGAIMSLFLRTDKKKK